MDPSEVDLSYEEAKWDGQGGDDGHEEGDEDHHEGEDQLPGGGGLEDDPAHPPADPGPGHFRPGVGLDLQDPIDPSPPAPAPFPVVDPPPPPSPSLESGEARHRREDRTVMLPDGSQFQISRRSSRSRASRPPSRVREYKLEDSSEEEGDGSSFNDGDEGPHPPPPPLPGPSPPRGNQSPPPDLGNPGGTGNTPGRNRGLGQWIRSGGKRWHERWVVRKPLALSPSPISPALLSPRPMGAPLNPTPPAPARPEEPGQVLSPGSDHRGDRPLRPRSPGEPAAPQHPPAPSRRSRQPPDRYQGGSTPAHRGKKERKGHKDKKL